MLSYHTNHPDPFREKAPKESLEQESENSTSKKVNLKEI